MRKKKPQKAQEDQTQVLMPLTSVECFVIGKHHYDNKDYEKAVSFFDQTIRLKINYIMIYTYRGNSNLALRSFNEAISDYTEAISISEVESDVYLNRGKAYYEIAMFDEARKDWTISAKLGSEIASKFLINFNDKTITKEFYLDFDSKTEFELKKWN